MNRWIAGLDNEALATGASQGSEDAVRVHYWWLPINGPRAMGGGRGRRGRTGEADGDDGGDDDADDDDGGDGVGDDDA